MAPSLDDRRVHPVVDRLAAYAWRLLVIVGVLVAFRWLLGRLWVVVMAVVIATLLTRALDGPNRWLRSRGAPPALAAAVALFGFLGVVGLAGWVIVPSVLDEFGSLGPTLNDALDDVERWLVDDSPFDIDQRDLEDLRAEAGDIGGRALRSSSGSLVSGVFAVLQAFAGLFLGLISTFFFLKDGDGFASSILRRVPSEHQDLSRRMAARAWETLGGYLRGAAMLGAVEAAAIGITLYLVGADLVLPMVVLTFAAAFVPFVGAVLAGVVAVLVALATTGIEGAVLVAVVALVVQQLDNDILAPAVYGHELKLHPLVVLFAVTAGGALFGLGGTVLAVPVTAVVLNAMAEAGVGRVPDEDPPPGEVPSA